MIIGVLSNATVNAEAQANLAAFQQGLQQLGWTDGRNVESGPLGRRRCSRIRRHAGELAALAPDVILATGNAAMRPSLEATHTVPIVFVQVVDPLGSGYVDSMARPSGNATGFIQFE